MLKTAVLNCTCQKQEATHIGVRHCNLLKTFRRHQNSYLDNVSISMPLSSFCLFLSILSSFFLPASSRRPRHFNGGADVLSGGRVVLVCNPATAETRRYQRKEPAPSHDEKRTQNRPQQQPFVAVLFSTCSAQLSLTES